MDPISIIWIIAVMFFLALMIIASRLKEIANAIRSFKDVDEQEDVEEADA